MGVTCETARKVLMIMSFVLFVGLLGIEPSLPAPKAGVLPVYDSPLLFLTGQEASVLPAAPR